MRKMDCVPPVAFPFIYANSTPLAIFMMVVSLVLSFNGFEQWLQIRRLDSAYGVSTFFWTTNLMGNFIWIFYSFALRDIAVFLASAIPALGSLFVLYEIYVRRDRSYTSVSL
jgi:uncharacterized protein with PQ loop repeat